MRHANRCAIAVLIVAGLLLTACAQTSTDVAGVSEAPREPATVERIEGTDLVRVVLTAKAAERLDIQTVPVRDEEVVRKGATGAEPMVRKVIPYSAVLYDQNGGTFAYINPEPYSFIRSRISVEYIQGDLAILLDGPPTGTAVVTVGVAELYGAELGIGK